MHYSCCADTTLDNTNIDKSRNCSCDLWNKFKQSFSRTMGAEYRPLPNTNCQQGNTTRNPSPKKINIHDGSKKKTLKFTSMLAAELNRTTNGANKELPRRNIFGKKIFTLQKYKNYTYSTCVTSEQC